MHNFQGNMLTTPVKSVGSSNFDNVLRWDILKQLAVKSSSFAAGVSQSETCGTTPAHTGTYELISYFFCIFNVILVIIKHSNTSQLNVRSEYTNSRNIVLLLI